MKKDNENSFVRMNVDELSGEKVGDVVDVFIYNDNKKLMATKKQPKIELGKIARLEVKDITAVSDKVIKSAGVAGVIKPGKTSVQVIIGPKVQFVADEFKKLCK